MVVAAAVVDASLVGGVGRQRLGPVHSTLPPLAHPPGCRLGGGALASTNSVLAAPLWPDLQRHSKKFTHEHYIQLPLPDPVSEWTANNSRRIVNIVVWRSILTNPPDLR